MVDRGVIYLRQGTYEQAEAAFRVAVELAPIPAAYDGLACVMFLQKREGEAERLYRRIFEWFPRYAQAKANLALLYDLAGRHSEAKNLYEESILLDPMSAQVRNNYGALLANSVEAKERALAKGYLFDAQVIGDHPIIRANIDTMLYNHGD